MRKSIFSPCRLYRYTLWREFQTEFLFDGNNQMKDGYVQFIGLNPSTADENSDDPTLRRCIAFTKREGYGAMCMTNLFAFRATDPNVMMGHPHPVGIQNNTELLNVAEGAAMVIAAWGTMGAHRDQANWVKKMMFDVGVKMKCFGLTKTTKQPRHPLYVHGETPLVDY